MDSPVVVALTVFALVVGAGALPLLLKPSERVLHAVIAIASGFFLGVTFLHLLPEVAHQSHSVAMWGCVLVGVLAVFFAEVLLRHGDPHQHDHAHEHEHDHPAHHGGHRVVGIASFVGLSVHTLGGAIGIGLSFDNAPLREALVSATLSHKAAEAFSLVSVLLLSKLTRRNVILLLGGYALVTPVGIALGRLFAESLPQTLLLLAEGLAAGTFLYVAVGELLPEVFHGRKDRGTKVLLLLAGIVGAALLFGEHVHEH
ncbi:MAG: ZIP family metal transporter [Planctomycetes bacterium]|nr:ZIP family metal transporter [Planctomycetota bacterium]